jgi:hypothetical protein
MGASIEKEIAALPKDKNSACSDMRIGIDRISIILKRAYL